MTQSGQGEEPSARPAHEGIVLPSDGGEPLLPGMTSAPTPAAPAGGQAWGGAWGPGQEQPQPGQGWPAAAGQQWHTPEQPPATGGPGPLPPEGAAPSSYDAQPYGTPAPAYGQLPGYGSGGQAQAYGQDGGQPAYGGAASYPQQYAGHELPGSSAAPLPPGGQDLPGSSGAPLPPAYAAPSAPLPPAADGATQYIPPVAAPAGGQPPAYPSAVPGAAPEGATQYLPPVAAGGAGGATQYIPPVAPGALPPEAAGEETRFLGRVQQQPAPAGHADAEATQYIPPVPGGGQGGDRQPPAEFDNLFRSAPAGAEGPAGLTQQMPRVQPDAHSGPPQQPSPRGLPVDSMDYDGGRRGGRTGSRVPLIAAIGVGIAVVGIGAGALLSGGGGDKGDDSKNVAASASASATRQESASPAADPAKAQAVELDKLLADSGGSRASVIRAVGNVRQCDNLGQAASDLRAAAKQRADLVTRLGKLSVDKLPNNAELTASLTKAWQASASADNHYAAWADQMGGKRGCHKGHAKATGQTQAGDRASATASAEKSKAAGLWNAIAQKYGLTQRQPTQL